MKIILNENLSIKHYIVITIFAFLIAFIVFYIALKPFLCTHILKNSIKDAAIITNSEKVSHYSNENQSYSTDIIVKYNYNVNNTNYENENTLWWKSSIKNLNVGDKIDIFYSTKDPSHSEVYHISYLLMCIGIVLIIFPTLILRQKLKG